MVIAGLIWLLVLLAPAKNPHHHGTPTPTPSPSSTPTPTPIPQVTLAWDLDADPTVVGYYFKLGFASGQENQVTDVGTSLTYTVALTSGQVYFFVVTAYNANRVESPPSNELLYVAP